MDSHARLDYVLFHLTPTRTRCDLVIFAGKSNEKLAYGLLDPFIAHLRSAKDQITKGGYSVTLRPPSPENSHWFTKATLQRFVRFVSTPEVLERFVTIEREISQLENSIKPFEASNVDIDVQGNVAGGNSKTSTVSIKSYGESNDSSNLEPEENSKACLHRVVETRKVVLWKEQAMVYARALAAGFELDNLNDLLSFSDAFGASRLREACINFRDLCKKKNEDRLWVDEIAAMQAIMQPDLSFMGTSGIVLAGEDNDPDTAVKDNSIADSIFDANQASQIQGQMQNPWGTQFPPYLRNFQGPMYQQMPPYQGYGFPGMQVAPHYPANMAWPSDRDSHEHRDRKSSSKKKSKKVSKTSESESSSETDASSDKSHRKKNGKKSSRKVIIRNINYISSKRDGEKNSESETSSLEEEDYHKETARRHKKDNGSKNETKGSESWDAFQQLLLKEDCDSKVPEAKTVPVDAFLVTEVGRGSDDIAGKIFDEKFEHNEGYHPAMRKGTSSIPEEFQFSQKSGEPESYARVSLSNDVERSVIKSHTSDWFVGKQSNEMMNEGEIGHLGQSNGNYVETRNKDIVIDDSLMIQGRLADEQHSDGQIRSNISMVSDIMEATQQKIQESQVFCEPDELYMVRDRDTVVEQTVPSWNPEIDLENNVVQNNPAKKSDIDASADLNANDNGANKKTGATVSRVSSRDAKSRTAGGPMRRGKPDTTPGTRRSTFGSKTTTAKSQFQKDEERRKRMEELLIRRQKRIAERGGDGSTRGRKPVITSSVTSAKETNKPKPVLRSSTIDRLAVAKTTPNSLTPPQPKKDSFKSKSMSNGSQKIREVRQKNLDMNKINPSEKKPGISCSKNQGAEIKFDEVDDSKDIKELHVTSAIVNTDVGIAVQSPETVDKSLEDVKMPEMPVSLPEDMKVSEENEKLSPELSDHPMPESPTKHHSPAALIVESKDIAIETTVGSTEISVVEESTPPTTSVTIVESTQSRKKWDGPETAPKVKGFRKLLMFGRKS